MIYETQSENTGWVHSVKFSPNGSRIAFVSHDSSLVVASPTTYECVKFNGLPFLSCLFLGENVIVAGGFDCWLAVFRKTTGWKLTSKLDQPPKKAEVRESAMDKFKTMDLKAQAVQDISLPSIHQNTITCVGEYSKSGAKGVFSAGLDGLLVIWDMSNFN